jgi:hypothetical protein
MCTMAELRLTGGVARGPVGRALQRLHVVGEALARKGGVGAPQLPKHVGKLRRQRQQLHLRRGRQSTCMLVLVASMHVRVHHVTCVR